MYTSTSAIFISHPHTTTPSGPPRVDHISIIIILVSLSLPVANKSWYGHPNPGHHSATTHNWWLATAVSLANTACLRSQINIMIQLQCKLLYQQPTVCLLQSAAATRGLYTGYKNTHRNLQNNTYTRKIVVKSKWGLPVLLTINPSQTNTYSDIYEKKIHQFLHDSKPTIFKIPSILPP